MTCHRGVVSPSRPVRRRHLPTSPFHRDDVSPVAHDYVVGDRVTYDRVGLGRVVTVDPAFVTVDFGDGRLRTLPLDTNGLHPL